MLIQLPRTAKPVFPDHCVVCSAPGPSSATWLVTRDPFKRKALLAGWFAARVLCCMSCTLSLHAERVVLFTRTVAISAFWVVFGVFYLLQHLHLPGAACGLITLGGIAITLLAVSVWERAHPPAFEITIAGGVVDYCFRDHDLGQSFANVNDAVQQQS